jgi:hypothetical protein
LFPRARAAATGSAAARFLVAASVAAVAVTLAARAPAVAAAPPPCSIPRVDRVVAVGDVHGAYSRLVEILRVAGLIDGRERWVGGRTHLVQVGDIVDRGPDSRKALDLLRRLEQDAAKAGGAVHVLIGNHEAMRMLTDLRYTVPGEYKAFATPESDDIRRAVIEQQPPKLRDQLLKGTPLGLIEMRVAFGPQGVYGAWLRSQNAVLRIDDVVFVHGGISPAIAALTCD